MRYFIIGGDGKEYGPASSAVIQQWRAEGRLTDTSRIRKEGEDEWLPLGDRWTELILEMESEAAAASIPEMDAPDTFPRTAPTAISAGGSTPWKLDPFSCLQRSIDLLRNHFYRLALGTFLFTILLFLIQLPDFYLSMKLDTGSENAGPLSPDLLWLRSLSFFLTSLLSIVLGGPLMGGLYRFYLLTVRGEAPRVQEIFSGFHVHLLQLVLGGMVSGLLTAIGFFFFLLPGIYLMVSWVFSFAVIIDQHINFWDAMEVSRRMLIGNWWRMALLLVIGGLISILGVFLLGIGIILTQPILFGSLAYAYEDLRSRS